MCIYTYIILCVYIIIYICKITCAHAYIYIYICIPNISTTRINICCQPEKATIKLISIRQPSINNDNIYIYNHIVIYIYIFIYTMLVNHPQHTAMNPRITINISEPPSTTINHYGSLQAAINENLGL